MANDKTPAEYALGCQLLSTIPVHQKQLKVRSNNNEDFRSKWQDLKEKQAVYYNKHSKNLKELSNGEKVRVLKDNR